MGGHATVLWQLVALVPEAARPHALGLYLNPVAVAFFAVLAGLAVAGLLGWSRLFPWGLLAAPLMLIEAGSSIDVATQPALTGLLPWAGLLGGAADLVAVSGLVWGAVSWWRRR